MKISVIFTLFIICILPLFADQTATTEDGRKVLLKDDGTWEYAEIGKITKAEGKWIIDEKINPIDDSKQITFMITADQGKGIYGDPIGLVLRYMSNETDIYIIWNSYLGSEAYVLTRFGDEAASTIKWPLSTDHQATFYILNPSWFVKKLTEVDRFIAQVTPYSENPITAIFDVRGLKEAIIPYNDILNWLE